MDKGAALLGSALAFATVPALPERRATPLLMGKKEAERGRPKDYTQQCLLIRLRPVLTLTTPLKSCASRMRMSAGYGSGVT